ncbi:MAG TPA: VOC family protein [Lacunisphaera sp.]|nr:VOC family protein [Lacunisphaera sp.]
MTKLTPFLLFDGHCAEAMAFYQSCFGGELSLTKISDTPMKAQVPPEHQHKVAHAHLKSGGIEFSATDWMHPTRKPRTGNTVSLYLTGDSHAELRAVFDQLATGADKTLLDDLREMPFGSYGHLADKYGVHWFFRGARKQDA